MKRVLVVGDVIEDVYRECRYKKQCPDAPEVPAVVESTSSSRPGGAANVALNVAALSPDCQVDLIGVGSESFLNRITVASAHHVSTRYSLWGAHLRKERLIVDGRLTLRVDSPDLLDCWYPHRVTDFLRDYLAVHTPDLIVLSEYNGGTVEGESLALLLEHRQRLMVDTKRTDLSVFGGDSSTLLCKLNRTEWEAVVKADAQPEGHFRHLVVTGGAEGAEMHTMSRFERRVKSVLGPEALVRGSFVTHTLRVHAQPVDTVDVCGSGDTFMAGLAAAFLAEEDPYSALQFANAAAATVVTQPRTAVADLNMTLRSLGRETK